MLRKEFLLVIALVTLLIVFTSYEPYPIRKMMDWRATRNAMSLSDVNVERYQTYDYTKETDPQLTIDFLKGKHFWNPQLVIWLEDSAGQHLETLFVTMSTARGLFYSGRTSKNFKQSNGPKNVESEPTRRVDALPYWSHKRGTRYADGFFSPPPDQPLPDGITGATPSGNFLFTSKADITQLLSFRVLVEVNVAFDENEYYSEYDFVEDSIYHSGTGLLGQPSLIYGVTVRKSDAQHYYVLELMGHGHHSGANGDLITETETITTAKYVVERIVLGVGEEWYDRL